MSGFWNKLSYFAIWITVLNDLINALGVYLILIGSRRVKERGVYSFTSNKLNKSNMLSAIFNKLT